MNLLKNKNKLFKIIMLFIIFCPVFVKAQDNNSAVVFSNINNYLNNDQTYSVLVTMKNTGSETWTNEGRYNLRLFTNLDNKYQSDVWGVNYVLLPGDEYLNSETVNFKFDIKAPKESGIYNCSWMMAKGDEFFGEPTSVVLVNVSSEVNPLTEGNNSEFVSQIVPSYMIVGQTYKVSVNMKNSGPNVWLSSNINNDRSGDYKLVYFNDANETIYKTWNVIPVSVNYDVSSGQTNNFDFEVQPYEAGVYNFQWMMKQGDNFFGEKSKSVIVNVTGNSGIKINEAGYNNSAFLKSDIPVSMTTHKNYNVSVTMMNSGKTVWTQDKYHLIIVDNKMNPLSLNSWELGYIALPENVAPGTAVKINFKVKAPAETGVYQMQLRMTGDNSTFGDSSPMMNIVVNN